MNRRERASLHSAEQPFALLRPTRSSETLIFLPTYNECDTLGRMIDALLALPIACDVLVVDDRSTDGTTGILVSRAAAELRSAVMVRPGKLGIGSAHILGWMHARRLGYRRIVTLDADFSHDPGDIPRLLAALDQGADVVIGPRFAAGGRLDYVGWRRFVSRSANYLARNALGLPISEYTTSLRAARLDRVPEGLVETIESGGYSFFLICMVRFVRAGLQVTEIPIHFHQRTEGTSKISHLEIVRGALNLVRLTVRRKADYGRALPGGAAQNCPACHQPFLIPAPSGGLVCVACPYREAAAANSRAFWRRSKPSASARGPSQRKAAVPTFPPVGPAATSDKRPAREP
ncbi:MAG TPA: polyprenol monophosphomannose synthase [Xanthobacteraceae bacterium]|nr:polyprenol monophosphomannose synthase [Xanthobacteraceae bacterium]